MYGQTWKESSTVQLTPLLTSQIPLKDEHQWRRYSCELFNRGMEIDPKTKYYTLTWRKYRRRTQQFCFTNDMRRVHLPPLPALAWAIQFHGQLSAQVSGDRECEKLMSSRDHPRVFADVLAFMFVYCYLPMLWPNSSPHAPLKGKQFPDFSLQHQSTRVTPFSVTSAIRDQSKMP